MGRLVAAIVVLMLALGSSGSVRAASWLDGPIENWNSVGMAVPTAPDPEFEAPPGMCVARDPQQEPTTNEEKAVAAAGWRRVTTPAKWWGATLVSGQQSVDGMCRPMQFQYFVFFDGKLAGTLSPEPMNSRTDGVGGIAALRPGGLDVSYRRYAEHDPLCCPSGKVDLHFRIEGTDAGSRLVPEP